MMDMHTHTLVTEDFFKDKTTLELARELLGCQIVHTVDGTEMSGTIIETEAYLHNDPASHAFKGKTTRNASMFKAAGTLYIYTIYGVHECLNIVTNNEGIGEAVLIRALEPLRNITLPCHGPARLVRALKIPKSYDGTTIFTGTVSIRVPKTRAHGTILATPRIGISKATDKLYRCVLEATA